MRDTLTMAATFQHRESLSAALTRRIAILLALCIVATPAAIACPFCESVQQTIRQQSLTMDAVVIASSLDGQLTRDLATGIVKMKIEKVLKGGEFIKVGKTIDAVYYGKVEVGRRFLLSGVDPPNLQWSCLPVSERAEKYIVDAAEVEDDAAARLRYYIKFLEDEEALISRDAYDEFASTPYEDIRKVADVMDREQLLKWAQEPNIGADRKRLYFTMLGVCGDKDDVPVLEAMLRNPAKSVTGALDALIACYLTLHGEAGLPLVDELYVTNQKAPFPQSYAAIMAIRFHGTDGDVIPRSALVASLHKVLERPELADMVIPDLARWNDWSQIKRLARLFKEAEKDKNWLRVPVINYLRACPLPEAEKVIADLEKIDPDAVRRAKTFFPIPMPVRDKSSDTSALPIEPGTRYAARTSPPQTAAVLPSAASEVAVGETTPANRWNLGCVVLTALVSLGLAQFLILTGGPARGHVVPNA
ncbi:MAG: hypothetical protein AAFX06_02565 [Planctomycetota bacterium]